MISIDLLWRRNELVLASVFACCLFVWGVDSFGLSFLWIARAVAGLYLAVFPSGFLLVRFVLKARGEMTLLELVGYSAALNIVLISLFSFLFNILFGANNTIWNFLRVVLGSSIVFFLLSKYRRESE